MRFSRTLTITALLAFAQMSAFAGQIAILKNGFSIHFDRKEQSAKSTRLFTSTGYLDIASDQITSFEEDETPVVSESSPVAAAPSTQLTSSTSAAKPLVSKPLVNKPAVSASLANPIPAVQPVAMKVTAPAGTKLYFICLIHPWMQAEVDVT